MRRYIVRTDFGFAGCVVESDPIELEDSEILDATGQVDVIIEDKIVKDYEAEILSNYISSELVPVDENGDPCEEGENVIEDDYEDDPDPDDEEAFTSAGRGTDESYGA
jgi:hypothetical protein